MMARWPVVGNFDCDSMKGDMVKDLRGVPKVIVLSHGGFARSIETLPIPVTPPAFSHSTMVSTSIISTSSSRRWSPLFWWVYFFCFGQWSGFSHYKHKILSLSHCALWWNAFGNRLYILYLFYSHALQMGIKVDTA